MRDELDISFLAYYKTCYKKELIFASMKRLMSLGFNEKQSKAVIAAIEDAMISVDIAGDCCEFEREVLPDAINKIEETLKEREKNG